MVFITTWKTHKLIGHWEQREKVQVFLWHLLGCYYKTMQGLLHQNWKMSYFFQRAGIKGSSSLSLQDIVMCCYLEKKGGRKAGEKTFSNQTVKECHKEAPSNTQLVASQTSGRLSELQRDDAAVQALPQTLVQKSSKKWGTGARGLEGSNQNVTITCPSTDQH